MKLNWGHAIAIVLSLFATGMAFAVYKAMQADHHLVSENYYGEELAFQQVIEEKKRAAQLSSPLQVIVKEDGPHLVFPAELVGSETQVDVLFYHFENSDLDYPLKLEKLDTNWLKIPIEHLSTGKWTAKTRVLKDATPYYFDPVFWN